MLNLLTRAPKIKLPSNPISTPKIHYTADDLPSIIHGQVTEEDFRNARHGPIHVVTRDCAVATSLKRMFPGIQEGKFVIGISAHHIGRRYYRIDPVGAFGISRWLHRDEEPFNYTLTEE